MDAGRGRLVRLRDEEVVKLLRAIDTLPIMWARLANTSPEQLRSPQPRTIKAVRTGIARNVEGFHYGLAWSAVAAFAGETDLDENADGPESDVAAEMLAQGVGRELGPDLGQFVVNVVAESQLPLAGNVKARLGELLEIAQNAEAAYPVDAEGEGATILEARDELSDSDQALADTGDIAEDGSPALREVAPNGDIGGAMAESDPRAASGTRKRDLHHHEILEEVQHLLELAPVLAEGLRELAASIQAGEVPRDTQSEVLPQATEWVSRAQGVVTSSRSLHDVATMTQSAINAHAARVRELEELLQAVVSLESQGLGKFAIDLLQKNDFADRASLAESVASFSRPAAVPSLGPDSLPGPDEGEPDPQVEQQWDEPAEAARNFPTSVLPSDGGTHEDELAEVSEELWTVDSLQVPGMHDHRGLEQIQLHDLEDNLAVPVVNGQSDAAADSSSVAPQVDASGGGGQLRTEKDVQRSSSSESASDADLEADAWESGLVAELIASDRTPLAVLAADSRGTTEPRMRLLRLLAGAFGSRSDWLLAQDPGLIVDESEGERNTDENRVLFAAYSRLALELGFSPVGSLERYRQGSMLEGPAADFSSEVVRLTTRGFKRPLGATGLSALPDDWRRYADSVEGKLDALLKIRISYQRASRIIHHLARANQAIGGILSNAAALARRTAEGDRPEREDWSAIESMVAELREPQFVDRLINDTDRLLSTPQQLRNAIVATALYRLRAVIDEVAQLLEEGLALRARSEGSGSTDDPQGMADLVALAHQASVETNGTVGAAAMHRLIEWVLAEVGVARPPSTIGQLLQDEMLPLFEIERDEDGTPLRLSPTAGELSDLVLGRDPLTVFRGYLDVGNVIAAELVLAQNASLRTAQIDDELAQASSSLARRQRELIAEVDRVLDRLRSLFDDDLVRQLGDHLEEHRRQTPGRFDLHLASLDEIRLRGEARLSDVREQLRDRAEALSNRGDSRRILALLESRDEQLAVDYLSLAEAGEALPVLDPPSGDDFGSFFPSVVSAAEAANRQRVLDNINDVRKQIGAVGAPKNRMLDQGLKSWNELVLDRRGSQMTEGRLANVLRMLGLIPANEKWIKELTKSRFSGYATYVVKATPIDRSYVPSFGTQAHRQYDVTIVWDEASPQRLLQYVEANRRTQANVVLYLRTLSVEQRLELRKLTSRPGFAFSPIVVDMPVVAWLSTRDEPGWRLTQRVTLPFTTLNPYTPFAGGEVPDEVFVGRDLERREIVDPTGSMFVYGGRQLGKSALLRRVEREIQQVRDGDGESFEHGEVAVYLDLKSEGIGESRAPAALWGAIAPRLVKAGVLALQKSEWTADAVTAGILEWLEADVSRRLLVLLDEADNFLTLDAKTSAESQSGGFPVLQRLKGLMERTGRRFKPVFAGLHQVQRFHGLPNTPVVHGGQDILIGPLKPVDARELVRDPLYALGYDFETPDTMWRLLRFTNYQASLIQIICEALVRHMMSAPLSRDGGRIVIKARDVDDVYAKREVRDLIAQRFRWTINLDNRYRVIALVTALRSLDSRPGERFRSSELHEECEYYWPAGFARSILSRAEFFRYLSEMEGLGVLQRQGEEFGLRSPSILGLLGARETIEDELVDASDQLEVDYQYNPTMNRRVLTQESSGEETRSPLPDSDLAYLLEPPKSGEHVKVVAGTSALGLDRVRDALHRAASDRADADRSVRIVDVNPYTLRDQIGGDDGTHLLLDLRSEDPPTRRVALDVLAESKTTPITVILPADDVPLEGYAAGWPVVPLQRWSLEGLQSWHESPFRRQELKSATGGWPHLVERAIALVMHGAPHESALASIGAEVRDPAGAREFLEGAGVDIALVSSWLEWFGTGGESGSIAVTPATLDDLSAAFGSDAGRIVERMQILDVIDESPDGWSLDPVVALATHSLQQ